MGQGLGEEAEAGGVAEAGAVGDGVGDLGGVQVVFVGPSPVALECLSQSALGVLDSVWIASGGFYLHAGGVGFGGNGHGQGPFVGQQPGFEHMLNADERNATHGNARVLQGLFDPGLVSGDRWGSRPPGGVKVPYDNHALAALIEQDSRALAAFVNQPILIVKRHGRDGDFGGKALCGVFAHLLISAAGAALEDHADFHRFSFFGGCSLFIV